MEETNKSKNMEIEDSPCHGPTLSTSTSSFELREPYDAELSKMATKTFEKINTYVVHDMETTMDNYKVLEQMNEACRTKYSDMQQISENLLASSQQLKDKFESLLPYINQIDEIDKSVNKLEECAYQLDSYSQKLESRFNNLLKKNKENN